MSERAGSADAQIALPLSLPTSEPPDTPTLKPRRRQRPTHDVNTCQLLTIRDVCSRLQCGRTYAYSLLQQGKLRAVKLDRLTRIPLSELDEFIAHRMAEAQYDVCERWSRGGDRAQR
jgi:excisionase family DNA binding protein